MTILRIAFASAFIALTLSACNKNEHGIATSKTASQGPAQPQEMTKPSVKKTVKIEEIDFSKYPGVIKPAAFGYYFGLTKEQIESAGIELEIKNEDDTMATASTPSLRAWAASRHIPARE